MIHGVIIAQKILLRHEAYFILHLRVFLIYIAPVMNYFAAGLFVAHHGVEEGRFARARAAKHKHHVPGVNAEIYIFKQYAFFEKVAHAALLNMYGKLVFLHGGCVIKQPVAKEYEQRVDYAHNIHCMKRSRLGDAFAVNEHAVCAAVVNY